MEQPISFNFKYIHIGVPTAITYGVPQEVVMQLVITALAVLAGLFFSFAISLLVEELIFGKIFGFFFAHAAAVQVKSGQKR
jgi:hypothetical protein